MGIYLHLMRPGINYCKQLPIGRSTLNWAWGITQAQVEGPDGSIGEFTPEQLKTLVDQQGQLSDDLDILYERSYSTDDDMSDDIYWCQQKIEFCEWAKFALAADMRLGWS